MITHQIRWPAVLREVVVIDTETTGFGRAARLVEVAAVHAREGVVVRTFDRLVNPGLPVPPGATRAHGITDAAVRDAPDATTVVGELRAFCAGLPLVAHNARFDRDVLAAEFERTEGSPSATDTRWRYAARSQKAMHSGAHALGASRTAASRVTRDSSPPSSAGTFAALASETLIEIAASIEDLGGDESLAQGRVVGGGRGHAMGDAGGGGRPSWRDFHQGATR